MSDCETEILDIHYLRGQIAGDESLEQELLRLMVTQCTALLPLLVPGRDDPAKREAAHALRGAAAALGARRLAASAKAVEAGGEPAVPVARAVEELRVEIDRVLHSRAA